MGIHRECGENITWLKRDDNLERWMPPMEFAGGAYIKGDDGEAIEVVTYRPHICDPDKVEAWIERLRRMGELTGDTSELDSTVARQAAREREQEAARKLAETINCDVCGSVGGTPCVSLSSKKQGGGTPTKWPHPQRLELAQYYRDRN